MMEVAKAQQTSPLLSLPDELLWKIARELLVIQNGDVVDCYCLAAFSLTCRRIAQATRTALFLNVPISSEAQLESLGAVPEHLLNNIRYVVIEFAVVQPHLLSSYQPAGVLHLGI